jgi:HPt (histidine-containing phosphotransfer) domain-containing protein
MNLPELAAAIGIDAETLKSIFRRFIDKTPEDLENLGKSISKKDTGSIKSHAHHIKGAALNLELLILSDTAKQLEEAAQKSNWDIIPQLFADLNFFYQAEEEKILKQLI